MDGNLIGGQLNQIDDRAAQQQGPERHTHRRIHTEAQLELPSGPADVQNSREPMRNARERHEQNRKLAAEQHHELHNIGPDDRLHAAQRGVSRREQTRADDGEPERQARHLFERQRRSVGGQRQPQQHAQDKQR